MSVTYTAQGCKVTRIFSTRQNGETVENVVLEGETGATAFRLLQPWENEKTWRTSYDTAGRKDKSSKGDQIVLMGAYGPQGYAPRS